MKQKSYSFDIKVFLQEYTLVIVGVLLVIFFAIASPSFLSWQNIRNLIVQNTHILIIAVGLTFVMMSGTLDLSVGYQISAIGVFAAMMMSVYKMNPILVVVLSILMGLCFGALNGAIAVIFKIDPMVVTLATTTIFQGISFLMSKGNAYSNIPDSFRLLTKGTFLNVHMDVWLAILCVAVASIVYNFTYYGRFVKAMGGNPEASRLAGINVKFMRISTFAFCSMFMALAAFVLISKQGTMNSAIGPGLEMTGMIATILGGISFNSGEGKMWGLVVGVFILAIIENGMQLAGWNQYIQYIVKGIVLVAAIGYDIHTRSSKIRKTKE